MRTHSVRNALLIAALAACSTVPRVPVVRFANAPVVTAVDDRRDVQVQPEERPFYQHLYHYDGILQRRLSRVLELPRTRRALGINALDEVPDSTWFTNRIGVREVSLDELRTGANTIDSPELHRPWTVHSTKTGGTEMGLMITDARGEKFLLKFDSSEFPEQETATHVIVGRLLWACGFNVTEDFVVTFQAGDLVLARDAMMKDGHGHKRPFDRATLDRDLAQIASTNGSFRGMASRWLVGKPLGGHPAEGVREDDPNDRLAHELRRDLRGAYSIFAWLDHVDIQESNFLDMWAKDPADPKRHYVKHYLLDFGKSLGVMSTTAHDPRHGHSYVVDLADMSRSLVTGGIVERAWEDREVPTLRGVGLFDANTFDPGAWKPDSPAYVPFLVADRIDKSWGARILIRFTRAQLRAIVETGRFSDPRAVDYITDTLVARQRATARYWFSRTSPLEHFAFADGGVCFDDAATTYGFVAARHYAVTRYDRDERALGPAVERAADSAGHACTGPLTLAGGDGYTIVEVDTLGEQPLSIFVYLARDPAGTPRVIGIWRP